jgi:mRNA interferase HigB
MVIISRSTINRFIENYPQSKDPLLKWFLDVFEADWRNMNALKSRFPSADYIGNNLFVFNIGGNKWRLIARVMFKVRTVFIRFLGTHAQYDKVNISDL